MKKINFLAAVMAVALVLLPLGINTIEASAEEPTTFAVQYVEEKGEWRFLSGDPSFDVDAYHRELYYMYQQMKDGDIVVVYNHTDGSVPELDLGDKRISNLTVVCTASFVVINCGQVDEFYTLANTAVSINSPGITKADVYDNTVCNFNCNVGTLNFYITDEIDSSVGSSGTVGHLYGYSLTEDRVYYDFYDFKADTLRIYDGGFQTPSDYYSTTPTAATPTPAPATSSSSGSTTSGSDYDDVPKTGESSLAMWLLLAAAICAGGHYIIGKKAQ